MPLFKENNANGIYKSSEYQLEAQMEENPQQSRVLMSKDVTKDL